MKAVKVGDAVELEVDGKKVFDRVNYVGNNVIEGEKFDLTHIEFNIIKN
tara:strand:- start:623 stop:769 length:147 start_codon:yes stop_codon:yes gene_type:complete